MKLGYLFNFESLANPNINGQIVTAGPDVDAAKAQAMEALWPLFEFEGPDDVYVELNRDVQIAWMV